MLIYFVRHGQSTGDVEDRYGGDFDDHLTEEGRSQSAETAADLLTSGVERLFSSPKIRAREAADIISERLKLPVTTLNDFRERNGYGVMTGMVKSEAAKMYPDYVRVLASDAFFTVEGAEEYDAIRRRNVTALNGLQNTPAETVAVVTHGGPIRLIFRHVLQLGEIDIGHCAIAAIEASGDIYRLVRTERIKMLNESRAQS